MNLKIVDKILGETEAGYDLVAGKFSDTRKNFWSDLEFIQDYAQDGDKVLDFGCGNGRLLEILKEKKLEYQGVDVSQKLIDIAKIKYPEKTATFQKISGSGSLAFASDFFNVIYSIAVFHHIPGEKTRLELARELFRVAQPGGHIVITVWYLWRDKYQKNIYKNRWNKIFFRSRLGWDDCLISFQNNEGKIFERFHHAWREKELREVFSKAGFLVEQCRVIGGNIFLVGKKPMEYDILKTLK
jgi:ubiquinone/menaquinone biosynthesis C-methylase UbiE